MNNSDVLRSVRYMLDVSEKKISEIIKLGGGEVSNEDLVSFLKKEDEKGYVECGHKVMAHFLNGLISFKRGKDESKAATPLQMPITNNIVLKKLRVAFELKDEDILALLAETGQVVTKTELSAFFRTAGHHNYRPCGDQFLRNFLKGLTNRIRK